MGYANSLLTCVWAIRPGSRKSVFSTGPGPFFFKDFIYLFLERGEGREKERERDVDV